MEIAIVGGGFCGLAAAWYLSEHATVTLIDSSEIGQGTSGMSSGLLHYFAGNHSKLNWKGHEGYKSTLELLKISSEALGKSVTSLHPGILRVALSEQQKIDYSFCAKKYPEDVTWMNEDETQSRVTGIAQAPGIWIKNGLTVYSQLYLQGLWKACEKRGVKFERRKISSLSELDHYGQTIITTGAATHFFPETKYLPLNFLKGQLLELEWPQHLPPLPCSLNAHVYLIMTESKTSCIVGGTYERQYTSLEPDIEAAKCELLPKLEALFPPLKSANILACRAGARSVTPDHLPLLKQIAPHQWVLAGMGSKGLLYHAMMAKELVRLIVT